MVATADSLRTESGRPRAGNDEWRPCNEIVGIALEPPSETVTVPLTAVLKFLEGQVAALRRRVAQIEGQTPMTVFVETFAPEPYQVLRPFCVVLRADGDEYQALFPDAGISTTAETSEEALANLKDVIIGTYEALSRHAESQLGPMTLRQLRVLKEVMRKID